MKQFVLILWHNDEPVTGNVVNITNIVEPRKEFQCYSVGEKVRARCPGFGIQNGTIGRIGDEAEKKDLQAILRGPEFTDIVSKLLSDSVSDIPCITVGRDATADVSSGSTKKTKKRVSTASIQSSPKVKRTKKNAKQKLDLERAASNLELLELQMTAIPDAPLLLEPGKDVPEDMHKCSSDDTVPTGDASSHANSVINTDAPSTSAVVAKSLNVLINPETPATICTNTHSDHEKLVERVSFLEVELNRAWSMIDELKGNVTWLYNSQQHMSNQLSNTQPSVQQRSCSVIESTSANKDFEPERTVASSAMMTGSECHETEGAYSKEQLMDLVKGKSDFCKSAKLLLRRLYKPEEYVGRSLTGSRANKTSIRKPPIEDRSRLNMIYEIIQEKWPYVTTSMINGKLAEVLKPSRN